MTTQSTLFDYAARYPHSPGYKSRSTSRQSAEAMAPKVETLREQCLAALTVDSTADEVAGRLNKSVLSIRPRVAELARLGKIVDSGIRRANESSHRAIVWTTNPKL